MKVLLPVIFALCTALCWGMYGPTIGNAQSRVWSPFKPYVFIGIAYLVLAILGGLVGMHFKGDNYNFFGEESAATKWGFLAGCLGALGALFLTSAMMISKGNALLVMPIVFGGAVSVTALFSAWRLRGEVEIKPALWIGIALVIQGVVITALNTPHGHAAKPAPVPEAGSGDGATSEAGDDDKNGASEGDDSDVEPSGDEAN